MIWLIGNKGMLGSDVELLLKKWDKEYIATDKEIDITNIDILRNFIKDKEINYIINCSAYTNVDGAESEKELAYLINGEGVKNISIIAKEKDAVLIHISTDYVFDGKEEKIYKEDDKVNPLSIYGKSKLEGERFVQEILEKYFIIRTAWLYGLNGKNFVYTMLRLFETKDEIKVVSDQYGTPTYSMDLAEVILKFIKNKIKVYGIYHFTNEGKTNWYEFAKEIYKISKEINLINKEVKIIPITTADYPTPAIRPHFSILDKSKIKNVLNMDIREWNVALRDFLSRVKENKNYEKKN